MNQIICTLKNNFDKFEDEYIDNDKYNKKWILKTSFIFFTIASLALFIYYLYFRYDLYTYEKLSKSFAKSYGITRIYNNDADYNSILLSNDVDFYENSYFSVIGSIDIEKINVSYTILSDISKDALKISTCRFYGPMPNEVR